MMNRPFRIVPGLSLMALMACQPDIPTATTWFGHASIAEGRRIPLTLHLNLGVSPPTASFRVGDESTPVPEVRVRGDSILMRVDEYDAAFLLHWDGTSLSGRYERYRTDTTGFDLVAVPGPQPQSSSPSPRTIALVGSYRVLQPTRDGADSASSAVFWSRGDSVFGTIVAPSGDDGLMAGVQSGDTVRLARFTGWQSIYIELVRNGTSWEGLRFVRALSPSSFRLVPRPGAEPVTPANEKTRARKGLRTFRFSGVSPEGDTVEHTDPRFQGKALIVDIMGTWCHNCLDASPVLQQIYEEYRDEGLEVVSLAFELRDDLDAGIRNIDLFRSRHDVSYLMLYAGDISKENVERRIGSQIENFGAYPTAIFIDRDGRIRDIHKGFRGPGTGEAYQLEIDHFYSMAELLTND